MKQRNIPQLVRQAFASLQDLNHPAAVEGGDAVPTYKLLEDIPTDASTAETVKREFDLLYRQHIQGRCTDCPLPDSAVLFERPVGPRGGRGLVCVVNERRTRYGRIIEAAADLFDLDGPYYSPAPRSGRTQLRYELDVWHHHFDGTPEPADVIDRIAGHPLVADQWNVHLRIAAHVADRYPSIPVFSDR